eukprot:1302933-Amphidinium_carterae.1
MAPKKKSDTIVYTCESLRECLVDFARVSKTLTLKEVSEGERLCCVLETYLIAKAKKNLRESAGHPVLVQFSSDCTPVKIRKTVRSSGSSDVLNTASAKESCEGYVQTLFLTCGHGQRDAVHH